MSFRLPSQPMSFPRPSTPPNRPATPTSPCPMDVSSTPVVSSTSLPSTSSIQFPQPPSSTPFPSVQNYPASPIRPAVFARTRRPSLLSLAIERTNKPSPAAVGLGNGNGSGSGSGTGLGSAAFIDSPAPTRRPRGYTFLTSSSNSSLSLLGGGSNDATMLSPTSSNSQREDTGMITPLEEPPINLPASDMGRYRGRSRDRRNGIIGRGEDIVRDLPIPKTPPRTMNDASLPTPIPGFKRGLLLKPSRLLMLQSELTAPPSDIETRSEAAFQRLLSTSSDLAQTLGLQVPGSGRGRTRKKSGLGNRYPESVGGGESDRDVGSRDRGGGVTKVDEDTTSSEEGEGDETFVLQKEATWDMELQVGSVGHERGHLMEAGSLMDVEMNDRSALSSPRSSISMPFQWRERSNPAYNRPGKRKFSEAQLLEPHSLTGSGNGSGPLSKRRRGGSPAPFPQPRSPVVHGRNHSNPWQARMPSTLSGRDRDKDRDRDRDASSDLMDGAMSAKSSPILRPTSSHGLVGALGLNGISIGSSLLGLQHTNTHGNGSGGNGNGNGNMNGNGGGGAGVGIPINIPLHAPSSSIGMGMSPGGAMSAYMMGSGLGAGSGGSPGLRPMHRLPKRTGAGGQPGKGVQEGVDDLRIQGSR